MNRQTDVVIVGTGAAGLFCALKLPTQYKVLMLTKDEVDQSDSFLAQGGMCMLRGEEDYDSYFEDTMKAGHYENNKASVDVMIRSSNQIAQDLIGYGVDFERDGDELAFTREGGHSRPRILFHEDITGKEITSKLLARAQERENITIGPYHDVGYYLWRGWLRRTGDPGGRWNAWNCTGRIYGICLWWTGRAL